MRPIVTVIIATFNSEKTLPLVLEAIKKQTYRKDKIEILLVDGGSQDKTLSIGKEFGCRIINNLRTEPVYGKFLGYRRARGKYVMYLDHDEVIKNPRSIVLKVQVLESNPNVKAIAGGNYKSPKGYPFINEYINEFGDPFSFFIYRLSKSSDFFLPTMKERYPLIFETKDFCIFDLSKTSTLPIIELAAGGSMFDADFLKKKFPETTRRYKLLPHYFYLIHSQYPYAAVIKSDPLIHYSADTLQKYFNKVLWRVKNNIYFVSDMGESGFTGREKFQPSLHRVKKYLFIPYAYSLIFPLLDAFNLALTRKNFFYFLHVPLTIFTASLILYHSFLKLLGNRPELTNYDQSRVISK